MIAAFTYQFQKIAYINLFRTLGETIVLYNNLYDRDFYERLKINIRSL